MFVYLFSHQSTSVLAVATTLHIAVLLLRAHRNPSGRRYDLLLLPSVVFAATPWLFPSALGLIVGLIIHCAWFVACDRLVPMPAAAPEPRSAPPIASRPATTTAPAAAPTGFVAAPVIGVFRETPDITTFRLTRPDGFDFKPGQFITVRIKIDGKPVVRCYSVSSAPESTGYLEVSVKKQGLVSGTLHATVRPGSLLEVRKPAGAFFYPDGDQRPVTLIAGGVGITPMICMLRHAAHADPNRTVTLLYSVHTQADIAFREELSWLARRQPNAKIVVTTTRGPHSTEYLSGRIDRAMLLEQVSDLKNNIFMICGPGPMIDAVTSILVSELGVDPGQVRSEAFEAAVAASTPHDPAQSQAGPEQPETYELRLVATNQTVPARTGTPLLEVCEAAGIDIPSACRAGVCGTCRTRLVAGEVSCRGDALDEGDLDNGYILPCVACAISDCALEA